MFYFASHIYDVITGTDDVIHIFSHIVLLSCSIIVASYKSSRYTTRAGTLSPLRKG